MKNAYNAFAQMKFAKISLILLALSFMPSSASASWESFSSLLCGTGTETETWNGQTNTYGSSQWCAPFNKFGNRDGCLKQFDPPQNGLPFYLKYCAEESPSSSYFYPKIRVRYQACNIACWAMTADLDWDGACVMWPIPTIFPLARFCARMAVAGDPTTSPVIDPDPGYTRYQHLDFEGVTKPDPTITGTDGLSTYIVSPKTCAYWDPWAFEFIMFDQNMQDLMHFDMFDYNPIKQPFHHTGSIHPIAQMAVNLLEAGLSVTEMCYSMTGKLYEKMDINFMKTILDFISDCIQFVGKKVFIDLVKEFGQLNHVVYANLGCVNVPKGPFPPPYWPTYRASFPAPTVYNICPTYIGYATTTAPVTSTVSGSTTTTYTTTTAADLSLITAKSTKAAPCVDSIMTNDFINNAVRISFDNKIALCPPGQPTGASCVSISAPDLMTMASLHQQLQDHNYMIYPCPVAGQACVTRTTTTAPWPAIPATCGGSSPCGFRVIFGTQYAATPGATGPSATIPAAGYDSTLPDCPNSSSICQTVWGIDSGNFTDVALGFATGSTSSSPAIETTDNAATLYTTANLSDELITSATPSGSPHAFTIAIARTTPQRLLDPATTAGVQSQDPTKICVYQPGDVTIDPNAALEIVSCVDRAPSPSPSVITCGSTAAGSYDYTNGACANTNSHFSPTMVVQLQVGNSAIQGPLTALSIAAHLPAAALTSLNLAGIEYTSIVTDNTFIVSSGFPKINNTGTISPLPTITAGAGGAGGFGIAAVNSTFTATSFPAAPNITTGTLFGSYKPNSSTTFPNTTVPMYVINPTYTNGGAYTDGNNVIVPTGAQYVSGLEYIQNQYIVGGNWQCLNTPVSGACPSNIKNCVLANLTNATFIDCATFASEVTGKHPSISLCPGTPDPSCTVYASVTGATIYGTVTVKQCGSGNPCGTSSDSPTASTPGSSYCCYSYSSSTTTGPLCTPSLDPAQRVWPLAPNPAGSSPALGANDYYNPNVPVTANQAASIANAAASAHPPANQLCTNYLQTVRSLTNPSLAPYVGIAQCTSAQIASNFFTEQFVSSNPSQTLQIYDNYNQLTNRHSYCYNPVPAPATALLCNMNTNSTTRLDAHGAPIEGALTCPLSCGRFIGLLGDSDYNNIQPCGLTTGGLSTVETLTDTSQTPAFVVNIKQYIDSPIDPHTGQTTPTLHYCYSPPSGATSCNLSCTATQRTQASSMSCQTYLSLINNSYVGLSDCLAVSNTSCPSDMPGYAAQHGYSHSTCAPTVGSPPTPSCSTDVTITSTTASSPVIVRTCTANLTFTNTPTNIGCATSCSGNSCIYPAGVSCVTGATTAIYNNNACQCGVTTAHILSNMSSLGGSSVTVSNSPDGTTTGYAFPAQQTPSTKTYSCYNYTGDSIWTPAGCTPSLASPSSCTPPPDCIINSNATFVAGAPRPAGLIAGAPRLSDGLIGLPALSVPSSIAAIVAGGVTPPPATPAAPGSPPTSIDQSIQGIRTKTSAELGLCSAVAPITGCSAITTASSASGYATWAAASQGNQSQGACMSGYASKSTGSLLRYCRVTDQTAATPITPAFEPITSTIGCLPWTASINFIDTSGASQVYTSSTATASTAGAYSYISMWGPNIQPTSQIVQSFTINLTKWNAQTSGFSTANNSAFWVTTPGSIVSSATFSIGSCASIDSAATVACPAAVATILGLDPSLCLGYDVTNCLSTGANSVRVTLPAHNASTGHMVFILP